MVKNRHSNRGTTDAGQNVVVRRVSDADLARTIERARKMTTGSVVQSLKDAGILTRSGKLAAAYRRE